MIAAIQPWDDEIRRCVQKQDFTTVFQPVFSLDTRQPVRYEMLARFDVISASGQPASTQLIVDRITCLNLTCAFDMAVLDKALQLLALMRESYGHHLYLAVNVCPTSLASECFVNALLGWLAAHRLAPGQLMLEITEGTALDPTVQAQVLPRLIAHSVVLAVDDFMTGHANFNALLLSEVSVVKVDRSVTAELNISAMARRFIRGLVPFMESLSKRLVVEGVENASQLRFLEAMGCEYVQGFFLGRPMAQEHLADYCRQPPAIREPGIFSERDLLAFQTHEGPESNQTQRSHDRIRH
ncbi:MAG: GGDEF family protein [Halomonadaceae bacterium T82-2]|nr:MAG: GGDEF family protein [Halomonadaceae bacterium T82-2]